MGPRVAVVVVVAALIAWLCWLALHDDSASVAPSAAKPLAAEEARPEKETPRPRARAAEETPTEPPAPAAGTVPAGPSLSGRVVDSGGQPVAGATVVSHPDDLGKPVEVAKAGAEGSRSFTAKTGADGRFDLRIDPKGVLLILTATADSGFGQVAASPKDAGVEIKLVPWKLISGKVTNKAKEPVAGAKVTMHLLLEALVEDRTAVTDANGDYRIDRLPPIGWSSGAPSVGRGRHGWIQAEADGYAPLFIERDVNVAPNVAEATKLDLTLVRGMTLSGKVVDGDTKAPLAGATVVCWSVEGMIRMSGVAGASMENPWGPRPLGEMQSAEDGSFRFEHLPAQGPSGVASHNGGKRGMTLGHVAAWKEGYVYGGDEIPVSSDGYELETTIELWPSATVEGRVVDAAGKPVAGAWAYVSVEARSPALNGFPDFYAESRKARVKSDADGSYVLSTFRASRAGPTTGKLGAGVSSNGTYTSAPPIDVTASAGETVHAPDLVLELGAIPRATFVVRDEQGAAVAGAMIERQMRGLRTGLDGRADWSQGFPPKAGTAPAAVSVVVRARGFAPQQVTFTPALGTPAEVDVVMRPGARIAGRVQRSDGSPAGQATIVVADGARSEAEVFGDGSRPVDFVVRGDDRLILYTTVTAADDGTFVAPDLPDGPYLVGASMPSRAPGGINRPPKMLREVRAAVPTGASDLLFTIPLDDAPPTQPLDVLVTDAAGGAVESCYAQAVSGASRLYAQAVEPTRLRFAAVPAGKWTIEVYAAGWAKAIVRDVVVAADAAPAPVSVKLERGGTVRGTVRVAGGSLPDGAIVMAWPAGESPFSGAIQTELKKDGSFGTSGFLPGRYRVYVAAPSMGDRGSAFVPSGDSTFLVPEGGGEVVLELLVIRAGSMSMYVRDKRLAAYGSGGLDAEKDKRSGAARIDILDGAGQVVFVQTPVYGDFQPSAWLAPGDYVVRLSLPGEAVQEQRRTVKEGESVTVSFPAR